MGKPSDHPDFERLDKEWRLKLAEAQFDDAEEVPGKNPDNRRLKRTSGGARQTGSGYRYQTMGEIARESRARYYEIIGQRIQETTFTCAQEHAILTLYFEGFTQEEIKAKLNPPVCRFTVYRKLYKWLRAWGLK